ncbi:MAG: 23S rRNA (adenine(2503)-C(2))-methyltransferase RlmN [Magnetococcales bacterium]|nr:23S rRNA (adenine(2503)-C(2))-methyltransferase RlmN [Magnetococcales bacterium]
MESSLPFPPPPAAAAPSLVGLTRDELTALMVSWGEKPFRARQLWGWVYAKLVTDPQEMTDLAKPFRARLMAELPIRPAVETISRQQSEDGTVKWLFRMEDDQRIETVYIPDMERGTLCVSSQAGCTLGCPFCHTGMQGFSRNLTAAEIVEQALRARIDMAEQGRRLTNIVFMGMGEPLYNYDAVAQAARILMDGCGLAIGTRKVTLSTAGVAPLLGRVGRELGVNLAISLHSVRDATRDVLVPLNRKYPLAELREAAREYPRGTGRRILWEWVLLDGVNDSVEEARELVRFVQGIPSKINLIPFNPWPGGTYRPSSPEASARFQEVLWKAQLVAVMRESRGGDIAAACGQLKGELSGTKCRRERS